MKKLSLILAICMILTLIFSTTALAETGVGYNSAKINGSGSITVTASSAPKYVYITIVGSKNITYGAVTMSKPTGGDPILLTDFDGDISKKFTITAPRTSGDYTFYIDCVGGSCTVNITMTK